MDEKECKLTVSWCFFTASWLNSLVARMHMDSSARYLNGFIRNVTIKKLLLLDRWKLAILVPQHQILNRFRLYLRFVSLWDMNCPNWLQARTCSNWGFRKAHRHWKHDAAAAEYHLKTRRKQWLTSRFGSLSLWIIRLIASNNTFMKMILVKSSIKMLQSYRIFGIAVLDFLRLRRLLGLEKWMIEVIIFDTRSI